MQGEGLKKLQSGQPISTREQLLLIAQLSWPAILAQISSVVMQYIDTAMVGQLGSNASAAIGVVATTSWLFGDLCIALTIGFNVAVAQALGARQSEKARGIMKLAFLVCMAFSLVMMAIALGITGNLPRWLRADPAIWQDASAYFLVFVLSLPFMQLNNLCGGLLRSAGNMKTPGICMVVMCLLDVVFNAFLIFPSGTLRVLGVTLPGFGLGVLGASMGTALSQVVIAVVLVYILLAYQFGDALQITYANSLRGIGDVISMAVISFIGYFLIAMPVCYICGFVLEWGITGIWIGYPIGLTLTGVMLCGRYYWKLKTKTQSKEFY